MVKLERSLGLFQVTVMGVGIILGAGIYALIGVAASNAGNATWLSFFISAVIAIFTGLSYAELSSMFKGDSAEYHYLATAFNKKFAFVIGASILAAGFVSSAAVALGFGGYFGQLVGMPIVWGAILLIVLMTVINFIGIKESSWFNTVSTSIEFLGLLVIIVLGITKFGSVNYFEMPAGLTGVFSSAALVFFAYLGFEGIVKLREETINPEKTIPKALVYSILITSVVYVLVAISAVSIVGWEALAASDAPLATAAAAVLGSPAFIVLAIIALFSTANTVLIMLVTNSRMIYGMAKEMKSLPKILSKVHKKTRTPYVAILVFMLLCIAFTLIGDLELVANLTNLFVFITFASVNLALIVLRYKEPKMKRPFKCPLNVGKFSIIALVGFLTSLFMLGIIIRNLIIV
jgi:basic amino acid/polyamine antiporter, APA family